MSGYKINAKNNFLIDGFKTIGNNKTFYEIKDLPSEDRPLEKIVKHGPSVLSLNELLSLVLFVGTRKEKVVSMSQRIIRQYGEKVLTSQRNPEILAKDMDIPVIKAAQIVACAEIGRRLFQDKLGGLKVVRKPEDIFEYLKGMGDLPKENLRGLYLNIQNQVIHDEILSIGTMNANIIHPREVFRPALEYGAVAVVLAHNHPSQNLTPSEEDIEITNQIVEAGKIIGIELLDHLIITKNSFYSITFKRGNE
jgi:DNA repair protein RadC